MGPAFFSATIDLEVFVDDSVLPTRYFLAKPAIGEEMSISIEKGKTLTVKLLAVGPLNTEKGTRECFFELNGEVSGVLAQ